MLDGFGSACEVDRAKREARREGDKDEGVWWKTRMQRYRK